MQLIRTSAHLKSFRKKIISSLSLQLKNDYQIELLHFSRAENLELTHKINKYKNDCGCTIGSIFVIISIITQIKYLYLNPINFASFTPGKILLFLTIMIISGLLGKLVGLAHARFKMYQVVNKALIQIKKGET